jgi:hypothetical protein
MAIRYGLHAHVVEHVQVHGAVVFLPPISRLFAKRIGESVYPYAASEPPKALVKRLRRVARRDARRIGPRTSATKNSRMLIAAAVPPRTAPRLAIIHIPQMTR